MGIEVLIKVHLLAKETFIESWLSELWRLGLPTSYTWKTQQAAGNCHEKTFFIQINSTKFVKPIDSDLFLIRHEIMSVS